MERSAKPSPRPTAVEVPRAEPATTTPTTTLVKSTLDPIRPVRTCERAVVLAIDRSGSMIGLPIDMAKKAALDVARSLRANDCIGVLVFDSVPARAVPLRLADDPTTIGAGISMIVAGGGTEIGPALAAAFADVRAAEAAKTQHVVMLTDGQSPRDGLRELARSMADANVTLSIVGLGSGVDRALIADLASAAGGRSYLVADPNNLPQVITTDVHTALGPISRTKKP